MLIDDTVRNAWWRFVRLWRPMAVWTIIVYAVVGLALGPLLSSLLALAVFRAERPIVGNVDLLRWVVDPLGATYLLAAASIAIMGAVVRYAGIFHIITGDEEGTSTSTRRILLDLLPDFPALFRLCLSSVAIAALAAVPLVIGLFWIYHFWLSPYDINYYLVEQPQEWRMALILTAVWTTVWAAGALYLAMRTLPSLPAYLDGHRPLRRAIKESWERTRGDAFLAVRLFAFCVVAWIILRATVQASYQFIAAGIISAIAATATSLNPILYSVTAWAGLALLLDGVVSFLGFSFTASVLTKFYLDDTDLHRLAPPKRVSLSSLPRRMVRVLLRLIDPRRSVPILGLILLLSTLLSGRILGDRPGYVDFAVSAHRAGASLAPENTLLALERSIDSGADYVEIDVQLTRDSVLVVVHDADLMRVAGESLNIKSSAYDDIRDVIQGDIEGDARLRRVATLDEFLSRAKGRVRLMIELKQYGPTPALVPAVIHAVRRHSMEDQVIIISLEPELLREIVRSAPEISTGYVASLALGDLNRLPVDVLLVSPRLISDRLVRAANASDKQVFVWTLNDTPDMLDAVQRGADGIITDDPMLAVELRDELSRLSAADLLLLRIFDLIPDLRPAEISSTE